MKARPKNSRLQRFLDAEGLTSAALEEKTGIARQSMAKIRAGRGVRIETMRRILRGVRELTGRAVTMNEIFDIDE